MTTEAVRNASSFPTETTPERSNLLNRRAWIQRPKMTRGERRWGRAGSPLASCRRTSHTSTIGRHTSNSHRSNHLTRDP